MTPQDKATAFAAADLRDTGEAIQTLMGRDMTLETYLTGEPSLQSLLDWYDATVLVAQADQILNALGVSTRTLYN